MTASSSVGGTPVEARPLAVAVLAAGEGTRMRSQTPKMLQPLCGRPMLLHVLDHLRGLPVERVVVVVRDRDGDVGRAVLADPGLVSDDLQSPGPAAPVELAEQRVPRGTGDAVSVALSAFAADPSADPDGDLLIVLGDVPLLRLETLVALVDEHRRTDAAGTVLTAVLDDPTGYGRVVRGADGRLDRIVEHADATDAERSGREVNTSIYCFRRSFLAPALRRLAPDNAKGEYYLTDVIDVLRQAGHEVLGIPVADTAEVAGVNDRAQLATAERELRRRINHGWMLAGVAMTDPERTYVDATVELAADVRLLPGTTLTGATRIAGGATIGPDCDLADTEVGSDAVVRQTVARGAVIGRDATVGPFVSLRPGTRVGAGAHLGTFVEIKNSDIGDGAKVPHLSYVGDASIGAGANLGAGTVTANYDGRAKHRTTVGDGVRTGVHTVLIAPVEVGDGSYTGAGAVVNRDVPPGALAVGVPARIEEGWVARREDDAGPADSGAPGVDEVTDATG